MQKLVTIARNPFEPLTWTHELVDDVCVYLTQQFETWPSTARVYCGPVCQENDITPSTESDIDRLGDATGDITVIVYPGDPITIIVAIVAVVVVAAVLLKPTIPSVALRNTQTQSSNNELSNRVNKPRPLARIADIYGEVRSTPDLIAVPYKLFINNEEVEYAYSCIGRGHYDPSDIRDDTTRFIDIPGSSVAVYGPNTSPNSGHSPILQIGDEINEPVLSVLRSNAVNGQVLRAPNDLHLSGAQNVRFVSPNQVQLKPGSGLDFTNYFTAGDTIISSNSSAHSAYVNDFQTITAYGSGSYFKFVIGSATLPPKYAVNAECVISNAYFSSPPNAEPSLFYSLSGVYEIASVSLLSEIVTTDAGVSYTEYYCKVVLSSPELVNPSWSSADGLSASAQIRLPDGAVIYDLDGSYVITSVSDSSMTLSNPSQINADWLSISTTDYISPILSTSGFKWVGPFRLDHDDLNHVYANLVAPNGLYKDDGKNQVRTDVTVKIELVPINPDGSPRSSVQTFEVVIEGSSTARTNRAVTLKAAANFTGLCTVRACRLTPSDLAFEGSVVDEVKWRDVYAVSPVSANHFGNVTTVQSVSFATAGALAIKERKLNLLVIRKLPSWLGGDQFTTELYPTKKASDIISAICLDPYIGGRSLAEVDFTNIYETIESVQAYFGHAVAGEFSYTFDSSNMSFEESIQSIANSVFCVAYRRGSVIKLNFERSNQNSTVLFNHRNKVPRSESRSFRFGNSGGHDGVDVDYVDPIDDAPMTFFIPTSRGAVNPQPVENIGVRSRLQAYFHAQRAWAKVRFQNTIIEFEATQEADLIVETDRILVADNTRSGTQDGEVLEQNVLELLLSQPVVLASGVNFSIFLQHYDGTIEGIGIQAGSDNRRVILASAPRLALSTDASNFARCTYVIVGDNSVRKDAFIVSGKNPKSGLTSMVRAYNYDDRYYASDKDFINGLIDSNGNLIA